MKVSVITASKHESTREVGAAIAARLNVVGHDAHVLDAEDAEGLKPGEPVVLGSALYMGRWLEPARELAATLASEDPGRPLWLFTVGPIGDPPEPGDAKPDDGIEALAAERARDHRVFAGRLDREHLKRRERLVVRALKAPYGDFRDWDEINAWADQIGAELGTLAPAEA